MYVEIYRKYTHLYKEIQIEGKFLFKYSFNHLNSFIIFCWITPPTHFCVFWDVLSCHVLLLTDAWIILTFLFEHCFSLLFEAKTDRFSWDVCTLVMCLSLNWRLLNLLWHNSHENGWPLICCQLNLGSVPAEVPGRAGAWGEEGGQQGGGSLVQQDRQGGTRVSRHEEVPHTPVCWCCQERGRVGGDWVVAGALINKQIRQLARSTLSQTTYQ